MIATKRRMATLDFLLVALSATVALQAFWPAASPRQAVDIRNADGHVHRYSLAADDPRLAPLTQAVMNPPRPRPTASLAKLKWLAETADFYVSQTEPKRQSTGYVFPASFRHNRSSTKSVTQADALAAERNYWIEVREESRQKIAQAEAKLRLQQTLAVPPPIVLGDVIRSGRSRRFLLTATLLGLGVASFFACWTYACPAIDLRVEASLLDPRSIETDRSRPQELCVVIPARWVRVHQPASVTIRRVAQTAMVVAGLLGLFASVS